MTYGEAKNRVLMLLNQYSIAGQDVAGTYNNQQDYLNRIPGLLNDALREIGTTARKIPETIALSSLESEESPIFRVYTLPEDFYQFLTGDTFVKTAEGMVLHTTLYSLMGRKYFLVPLENLIDGADYHITYYRYPKPLPESPADSYALDNVPEAHDAAAFYAAAFLAVHDDSFLFSALYNKYEDKLAKMSPGTAAELADTRGCCGDVCNYGVYVC